MSLKILQLSDLHIGNTAIKPEDLPYSIEMALRGKKVDLILFTGDLIDAKAINGGNYGKLKKTAVDLFKNLIEELNDNPLNNLSERDVLFVPGNHEINRANYEDEEELFDRYKEFMDSFYNGNVPEYYNTSNWSVLRIFEDEKIAFAGFNSAKYTKDDAKNEEKDFGEISRKQLSSLTKKLDSISNINEYNIVSFLHHHFYLIEERDKSYIDNSVLQNRDTFLRNLNKYNLGLILHGHKHDSTDRRLFINSKIDDPEKITTVLGCGTIDKKDTDHNSFNYIEVFGVEDSLDLIYEEYTYKSSTFEKTKEVKLPLKQIKNAKVNILEMLKEDSELEKAYTDLTNIDSVTPAEDLAIILDKTVGMLNDTAVKIAEDKRLIFYMLGTAHYRENFYQNEKNYLSEAEKFIKDNLNNDFKEGDKAECLFDILNSGSIYEVHDKYKNLKEKCSDIEKKYLTFIMVSLFLTELYINLKNRSEEFYKIRIKTKSDLKFEEASIYKNIEGNTIEIDCDEDKRALGIRVVCKNAEAHKLTALIIKEFEIILAKYEEDFSKIGFKIYYISPIISKLVFDSKLQLESYNFGAYIPTLIPLLAGEKLYSQVEAFSRELIQNSVEAINMRKELVKKLYGKEWLECGEINITIGKEDDIKYFEISDNGTGMDKYILERYFTTIGRSFYKSEDFENLKIQYNPISQFGIGFLSCFMVAKKVEVFTKYFQNDAKNEEQCFYMDIPNFDGCFFIENQYKEKTGTRIRSYENKDKNNFDEYKIYQYITSNILNVPYDINLSLQNRNLKETIQGNMYVNNIISDTSKNRLIFCIPFYKEKIISDEEIDMDKYCSDKTYREKYLNGMLIYKKDSELHGKQKITVTNCGILVKESEVIYKLITELIGDYFDVFINFSSDLIELEVSRDELKIESKFIRHFQMIKNIKAFNKLFSALKLEFLYKKADSVQKLPYYILRELDNDKYGMDKLLIAFEDNKYKVKYINNPVLSDYLKAIGIFLDLDISDCIYGKKDTNFFNSCEQNDFIRLSYIIILAYQKLIVATAKNKYVYTGVAMAMARGMGRGMGRRDTDMARAKDTDIAMARAMDMVRARAMARDINMARVRAMDMAMGMAMERTTTRAMAMEMAMDMAMDMSMSMAVGTPDNIINKVLRASYFEYYADVFERYGKMYRENFKTLFFDLLNGNAWLTIVASTLLNIEQLEKGFDVDIGGMKKIMNKCFEIS